MTKLGQRILDSLKEAPAQIRKYIECKAAGHDWEPYVPIQGKPLLHRKCRKCGVAEINTR